MELLWLHQAEFAGLYTADQQGYFAQEGLDVLFIVQPFACATLRGWTYTVQNPESTGTFIQKYQPNADADLESTPVLFHCASIYLRVSSTLGQGTQIEAILPFQDGCSVKTAQEEHE